MKTTLVLLVALLAVDAFGQPTAKNDDTCDIALLPAATLLLPYFEVDLSSPVERARTTYFTVINTTRQPQIAHVTIWSDWAYPVIDFNVFLTGYDVQPINLYDVIVRGLIAPPGTSNANTPGTRSLGNVTGNPNFAPSAAANCSRASQPVAIPPSILADVQSGLTSGAYSLCGSNRIGGVHLNAIGYVTIDVVATCSFQVPTEPAYYTDALLFDNVLTGDFQSIDPVGNTSDGGPLVHIRAVPEGGAVGSRTTANLPVTFYDRYTPADARNLDRRQPLPSVFAARFLQNEAFATRLTLWREALTGPAAVCSSYVTNRAMRVSDVVRFDERENLTTLAPQVIILLPGSTLPVTPATSMIPTTSPLFPILSSSGDAGGWLYFNLDSRDDAAGAAPRPFSTDRASQNWMTISMLSQDGRYDVDFDATSLGNGCSPAAPAPSGVSNPIGPRP